jgi:hypothetical protein
VRRWCQAGLLRARRRGPKLWQVDLDALKAGDDWHRALYRAVLGLADSAGDAAVYDTDGR